MGMVRAAVLLERRICPSASFGRCLHNETKGKNDEQIQANVAHYMALRVSPSVDAKISVSGDAREGQRGGGNVYSGTERVVGVRGGGTERAGGSRAYVGADTAEGVDFRIYGAGERQVCAAGVQRVSGPASATVLGEPLLGTRLLCGQGRLGPRDDTEVCKMAGERGTETRGVPV
jgi:hypothetical protein